MIDIAAIDQEIGKRGRFCLIDWLLESGLLYYADYEAWRYGKKETLDGLFQVDKKSMNDLLQSTNNHCKSLGLVEEPQAFYCWDNKKRDLVLATNNETHHQQLTQRWLRPQDVPQLDIFMDNSAQLAEHALLIALTGRQFESAQTLLEDYVRLNAECARLGGYQDLINYGLHMQANSSLRLDELAAEREGLLTEVIPLAKEVLGELSRDYLAFAWRRLANAMQGIVFTVDTPQLHISAALMEVPDYVEAITQLTVEDSLYQQPILLSRLIQSYTKTHQLDKALITYCHLMELDCEFAELMLDDSDHPLVRQYWSSFWEVNEHWKSDFFPAYLCVIKPELLHDMTEFPKLKSEVTQAIIALISDKLANNDEIPARRLVKSISPELLNFYLNLSS